MSDPVALPPADPGDGAGAVLPAEATPAPVSPLAAYLGLYLALLAFFLHLVAHTVPEAARTRAVAAALAEAETAAAADAPPVAIPHPRLAPVARLLEPLALPARVPAPSAADRLDLAIAAPVLFEPGAAALRPAARPTIEHLARLLAAATDPPLRLTLLVGAAGIATDTGDPPGGMAEAAAAASLARTMLAAGAPADRLAVGVAPAAAGEVRVLVRLGDGDAAGPVAH